MSPPSGRVKKPIVHGKEQLADQQREEAIDREVVELQRIADRRRRHDPRAALLARQDCARGG